MGATSTGLRDLERQIKARQRLVAAGAFTAAKERAEVQARATLKSMDNQPDNAAKWKADKRNTDGRVLARKSDKLRKGMVVRVYRSKKDGQPEGHISWRGRYTQKQMTSSGPRDAHLPSKRRSRGGGAKVWKLEKATKKGHRFARSITVVKVAMIAHHGVKGRQLARPFGDFGSGGGYRASEEQIEKHIRSRQRELNANSGKAGLAVLRFVAQEFIEIAVRL